MKLPTLSRTPTARPSSAARPRLILHAGSQKTGTTAIQFAMSENRDHLRAQGIWYPAIADFFPVNPKLSSARAHFAFANAVVSDTRRDNKRLARLLDAAATQPAGIDTILLSAETLFRLVAKRSPDDGRGKSKEIWHDRRMRYLGHLAELTADFDTEVLLYLRRVDRYAVSLYAESIVKTDKTWGFRTFLRALNHRFDYRQTIDEFAAHFPVRLRNFEAASANGLVQSFCDDIGLRVPLPDTPERRRPSVSNTGLLWLRRAKRKNQNMSDIERSRRWHFALRPENADLFALDTRTSLWPDRATRDAFIAHNQAGVTEIAFPEPVDDPAPKPRWSKREHRAAERRFDAWQRANAAAIRKRERAKIPPHVLDP
ncbi:MAG: hypothetical protein KDK28_18080 [Maritimibacter sp.]|nr:hypothetical protein [Maritimibacter sp.]